MFIAAVLIYGLVFSVIVRNSDKSQYLCACFFHFVDQFLALVSVSLTLGMLGIVNCFSCFVIIYKGYSSRQ